MEHRPRLRGGSTEHSPRWDNAGAVKSTDQRHAVVKPILGFGWIGVIASIVLAGLIAAHVMGVDLIQIYMNCLCALIPGDAFLDFVALQTFYLLLMQAPTFNLFTAMGAIVALRIVPERIAAWRYGLVAVWGFTHALPSWYSHVNAPLTDWLWSGARSAVATAFGIYGAYGIAELSTALVLLIVTRSWWVGASVVAASATVMFAAASGALGTSHIAGVYLWQVLVIGTMLTWAIHRRLRPRRSPTACPACEYELGATGGTTCPECGAVRDSEDLRAVVTPPSRGIEVRRPSPP